MARFARVSPGSCTLTFDVLGGSTPVDGTAATKPVPAVPVIVRLSTTAAAPDAGTSPRPVICTVRCSPAAKGATVVGPSPVRLSK